MLPSDVAKPECKRRYEAEQERSALGETRWLAGAAVS